MGDAAQRALRVLQVDPALFTAPYDAALEAGLEAAAVEVSWVTRPLRPQETSELVGSRREELFYRGRATLSVKQAGAVVKARKGASHLVSSWRLLQRVAAAPPDVVHMQWAVVPLIDAMVIRRLRRHAPVVLTVHDLKPFNASASSRLQMLGFMRTLQTASALIVHTQGARSELIQAGLEPSRIWHIPHGPLAFKGIDLESGSAEIRDARWRIVLFGKLQAYKGLDTLLAALERLSPAVRAELDVVVAGEPMMPMEPVQAAITRLGVDLRPRRLSESDAHALLVSADAFVFPYRAIEASGVLHLTAAYGRWTVASDLGAFREAIVPGLTGALVPPGDSEALAEALAASIGRRPPPGANTTVPAWPEIGARTREVYEALLDRRRRS